MLEAEQVLTCANCFDKRPAQFVTVIDGYPWCNDRDSCIVAAESPPIQANPASNGQVSHA